MCPMLQCIAASCNSIKCNVVYCVIACYVNWSFLLSESKNILFCFVRYSTYLEQFWVHMYQQEHQVHWAKWRVCHQLRHSWVDFCCILVPDLEEAAQGTVSHYWNAIHVNCSSTFSCFTLQMLHLYCIRLKGLLFMIAVVMDSLEWVYCPFCHLSLLHRHLQVVWLLHSCWIGTSCCRQVPVVDWRILPPLYV